MDENEVLNPPASLLVKLGSIAVHAEEMLSPDGHEFDRQAIEALLRTPDVQEWFKAATAMGLLPKKRNG